MGVALGPQLPVGDPGILGGGEGLERRPLQAGQHLRGGAVRTEGRRAVLGVGRGLHVPGVRRQAGAALADVAGEAVQRCRAQQVDLRPGAALGTVHGTGPGVRNVGGAVGPPASGEGPGQHDFVAAVDHHDEAVVVDGRDGARRAVVQAPRSPAEAGVEQHAVAGGVLPGLAPPPRSLDDGTRELAPLGAERSDAVGQVLAVGVADGEDRYRCSAVGVRVGHGGPGQSLSGGRRRAEVVFPAGPGAQRLALGHGARPEPGQGFALGGIDLAAVLGQGRGGDGALPAEPVHLGGEAARPDGLGLTDVAQAPQLGTGRGGDGPEYDFGVPGRNLGRLVQHDRRVRPQGPGALEVEAETRDRRGLDPDGA